MKRRAALSAAGLSLAIVCPPAHAVTDLHFDYTSFETGFQQAHFNILNYPSINGNYMMTSTDNHRPEMVANNNQLAEFYNWLTDRYAEQTVKDGAAAAAVINQYTVNNSTNNGPKPQWIVLNEISSGLWSANPGSPSISTYRTWLLNCVTALRDVHGFNVVTLAPSQNPGANDASWQALSAVSWVGVECYLSGTEVWNSGASNAARLAWATAQYQASKQSYLNRGVPEDKIFVIEHFANNDTTFVDVNGNTQTTHWGRSGLASAADWDQVIMIRQDAIKAVGFDGFLSYNWGGNGMGVTQAEQLQHEYYYRSRLVMAGQQPQWLVDNTINLNGTTIPLSWNQPLNWLGGVPNAQGAIANFFRTNTTSRTITLDGSKTIGTLRFNSPSSYTMNAGTGGTLTLDSGAATANVSVPQGSHTINVPLALSSDATFNLTGTLSIAGGITNTTGKDITKTGNGSFGINSTQSHGVGAILNANAGTTNLLSNANGNLSVNVNATTNFGTTQNLAALNVASGKIATLTASGNRVINTGTLSISGGKLNLNNGDMVVRSGSLGSWNGSAYTGITGLVQSGLGTGSWNGNGIITTMTDATTGVLTTLAVVSAAEALGISASQTATWSGQTVNGNAILVMYTWGGDADVNGVLDGDDYFYIDSNVRAQTPGYHNGDFDYNGVIDGDDYFIIDSNIPIAQNSPPMMGSGAGMTNVPEPAALMFLSAGAIIARHRRKKLPRWAHRGLPPQETTVGETSGNSFR